MSEKNKEMKTEDLIASLEEKGIKLWTERCYEQRHRTAFEKK